MSETNPDSVNNLKYLAEDLAAIAHNLDRTRPHSNPENLNWVLKKLADNVGNDNQIDGKLAEVAAMAQKLKAAPPNSNIQLGRWAGYNSASGIRTEMDIFDHVSKTFTEVKTTADAAKKKLIPDTYAKIPNRDQVADIEYSQVVAKMIAHQNNFPGAKFELWADAGGDTAALKNGVLEAISKFKKNQVVDDAMEEKLIDNFEVFNHPIRYRR